MRMQLAIFGLFVCLASPGLAQDTFPYVDEDGEEIFGPDYLPVSATTPSLPLYVAQPSTGRRIPENLLTLTQEAFRPGPELLALPIDVLPRQDLFDVPLLRDIRAELLRFQQPRARQVLEENRPAAAAAPQKMRVHYVFVGQGAGAIVELPCGVAVIDLGGEYDFASVYGSNGKVDGGLLFMNYLTDFMAAHPEYHNTLDVVFLSHPHADHINGARRLREALQPFKVKNVVDNGQTAASGTVARQVEFRQWAIDQGASYTAVELARQVVASGVTNSGIDPFTCAQVSAFWGGVNENILNVDGYASPNNHSVLVRLEFGAASFLFLGDLETEGLTDLLAQYDENLGALDVDVFQLAHHGSDGDTTDALLDVLTPRMAVISMGTGASEAEATAFAYGHPRQAVLDIMQKQPSIVTDTLDPPETHWAALHSDTPFVPTTLTQAIMGTGWREPWS